MIVRSRLYIKQDENLPNILKFLEGSQGSGIALDFNSVVPEPEEDSPALYAQNIYSWRLSYWGCVSNASNSRTLVAQNNWTYIEFETENRTCFKVFTAITEKYHNTIFILEYSSQDRRQHGSIRHSPDTGLKEDPGTNYWFKTLWGVKSEEDLLWERIRL